MNYRWEMDGLEFDKNIDNYFEKEDFNFLKSFNEVDNEILYENELLLKNCPIFIDDNNKIKNSKSILTVYEYYCSKLNNEMDEEINIFLFDEQKSIFRREMLEITNKKVDFSYIENINIKGIDSDLLNLSPNIFNTLAIIYKKNMNSYDSIEKFRNLHSAIILSDKVLLCNNDIQLYFHNPENEEENFKKVNLTLSKPSVNSIYYYTYKWIEFESSYEEIINIKHKVAKIYLSMFEDLNSTIEKDEEEIRQDLEILYDLTLQKKSKKYYEYNKLMKDHHISFLQQHMQIKTELNKRIMNMLILVPIAIYGLYLTGEKSTEELNFINPSYNFIYIAFLLAIAFLFLSLVNNIKELNQNYNKLAEETNAIYKLRHIEIKNEYTLNLHDFLFSIIWMSLLFLIIFIILVVSNYDFFTQSLVILGK